ncbi:hypothetical protein J31TS4_05660 [Paenibacillus sp. J31TS4]|uniref:hypothetical protein n=1 Tax=Paenibacillus sp. J31TS4 TaxID=2807195 RepID=UPI001B14D1C2|nr:hypothetical protein [Paenibacillus sp. J31TS4]GIP37286.1 hypothetical protein J31TS4_05660 [Paenibacillus sp. J31TS4]
MSEPNNQEPKKVSLADAVRNKLAQKKQAQAAIKANPQAAQANMKMKSQMTKKVNNQRRRTGGS